MLRVAYDAAGEAVPAYSHVNSPKTFTRPQLVACLVLKEFLRLDYRGPAAHLADHPDLCRSFGLEIVPHFTTFQKAAGRPVKAEPARPCSTPCSIGPCWRWPAAGGSPWRPSMVPDWRRGTSAGTT